MKILSRKLSAAEQMAKVLADAIREGRLAGKLPGVLALASQYDVSPATMRAAIRLLERQEWVINDGPGRPRMAQVPEKDQSDDTKSLNITIFPGIPFIDEDAVFQRVILHMQIMLDLAGHHCRMAQKSQQDLNHDPARIARFVADHPADAWIVIGPQSRVATWFAEQNIPVIGVCGKLIGLPIAGTGFLGMQQFEKVLRHLIHLGHRRIVFLWPEYRLIKEQDPYIEVLGKELASAGITLGTYNLPVWKNSPEGLQEALKEEFRFTRPTAIITTYGKWMAGVLAFLAQQGLRVPQDISLFSLSDDDWFPWVEPKISCLRGDDMLMVRRVIRWVEALTKGKQDRTFIGYPVTWDMGGSIGPVP